MTHVVHPFAHRLGGKRIRDWKSKWSYAGGKEKYIEFLKTDTLVREFLEKELRGKYLSDISIERDDKQYKVTLHTSRSGMIIGKAGDGVAKIKKQVETLLRKNGLEAPKNMAIDIADINSPDSDAGVVAAQVVEGLERKMPFRRVLKTTIEKTMASKDVKGVKITVSGRLGGAEMARKEHLKKGRIPLSTFRADVDYRSARANLPYGVIGVKVWIYKGDVFEKKN